MTIDEAIEHAEDMAKECEGESRIEHMQLALWLRELVERRSRDDETCAKFDRMRAECDGLRRLANVDSKLFFIMNECYRTQCEVCEANDLCAESVHLEGLYGIDKDLV